VLEARRLSPRAARWLVAPALALALAAAPALALTLEEVLAQHAAARGGREAWRAVQSLECNGTYTSFSKDAPFVLYRKRPNAYRIDYHENGKPSVSAFDGERAWWKNGMFVDWVTEPPAAEAGAIRAESELEGPLLAGPAPERRIELVGPTTLEGQPALELRVIRSGDVEETWYLDPRTYRELARRSMGSDFGSPAEQWSWYSDFRPVDGGIVLPHRIETDYGTRHRAMQVERVRVNATIDDALFAMPPVDGMEPLAPLVGTWRVTVETRQDPRQPWETSETTSTIRSPVRGLLVEELTYVDHGDRTTVVRSWSWDRFRQRYRVTLFDSFTTYQNVLEGTLADGALAATNMETKTAWSGFGLPAIHARLMTHAITPDGFKIDSDLSFDGGTSWLTFARFTYVRER
jgi:hypothetical protein